MNDVKAQWGSSWIKLRSTLVVTGSLGILLSLVRWGGVARSGPLMWAGVALFTGLILLFGLLVWWLYRSPLAGQSAQSKARSSAGVRQFVSSLALLSGMAFVVGGLWDEVWHRRFGGFGDDFLWPPHLLLYGSLFIFACFAFGGMLTLARGTGGIRQRFRGEPVIGLLFLASAYLVASLPSDQLWHTIYGRDLTAWSLPHVMIAGGVAFVMFCAATLQLSVMPLEPWSGPRKLRGQELLALLLIAWATTVLLQLGTTEWDGLRSFNGRGNDVFRGAFWRRPQWLYPVVVVSIALFSGTFALHAIRRIGVATLLALFVLLFRVILIKALGADDPIVGIGWLAHLLMVAPLLALDLWYAARVRRSEEVSTLVGGNLLAGALFLLAGLPIMTRVMVYPPVNGTTVPSMVAMGLLMALVAGWAGARFGAWLAILDRPAGSPVALSSRVMVISLSALLVTAVLILFVIAATSAPSA